MNLVYCVVPSFQSASTIQRAISSVLDQRGTDVRVTVVDHGSTDGTADEVAKIRQRDPRVALYRLGRSSTERRSASRPLNEGIQRVMAAEEGFNWYYFRLDSDDILASDHVFETMLRGAPARWILAEAALVEGWDAPPVRYGLTPSYRHHAALTNGACYYLPHQCGLVHGSLLREVQKDDGSFYEINLGYGEDLDLSMRLLVHVSDDSMRFVDIPAILKYLGPGTITSDETNWRITRDHAILASRYPRALSRYFLRYTGLAALDAVVSGARAIRARVARPSPVIVEVAPYVGLDPLGRLSELTSTCSGGQSSWQS